MTVGFQDKLNNSLFAKTLINFQNTERLRVNFSKLLAGFMFLRHWMRDLSELYRIEKKLQNVLKTLSKHSK